MRGGRLAAFFAIIVFVVGVFVYFTAVDPVVKYIHEGLDLQGGVHVVLQAQGKPTLQDMKKAETIMAFRANQFGVSSPVIARQGNNEIVVELPGIKNQSQAIKTIGTTARLVFKGPTGKTILTGRDLVKATAALGSGNTPTVNLTFNSAGSKAFATATSQNIGKTISIYLDTKVIEAATVQSAITNGQAAITGFASLKKAQTLASLLNSGALPIPMKIVEVRTISATLGAQSVHQSEVAGVVAMVLIGVIMLVIYRFAGLLADIALLIYVIVLTGLLIAIHAVLTLPGVAGMILSAGIAVDANVIIFARIKDEIKDGRKLGAAIDYGFKNAFRAILDSNVSTLLAAAVLYWLGTGAVRGFAVTLALGVLTSMLTSVWVTRFLLHLVEETPWVRIPQLFLGQGAK